VKLQNFGQRTAKFARPALSAAVAHVVWLVMPRDDLGDRCNLSGAQAMAADHKITELVEQAIINIVVSENNHRWAPMRAWLLLWHRQRQSASNSQA